MAYNYTFNDEHNYLVHFNKNHSTKNGQFVSGDGDGDGIIDDHHNQKSSNKKATTKATTTTGSSKSTKSKSANTAKTVKKTSEKDKYPKLKGVPKDRIYTMPSGEKVVKPLGFKDGTYTIAGYTRKNNAGVRLAYVSPNNLMMQGYWYDADTGKRASFGNQWHSNPHESAGKEFAKSQFRQGVNDTARFANSLTSEFIKAMLSK